uniref:Protein kinase domain-containing protein n=1 Tax=Ditylenchus dipsaci TaxID=166011 RepID=A0A915E6G9_9BILA
MIQVPTCLRIEHSGAHFTSKDLQGRINAVGISGFLSNLKPANMLIAEDGYLKLADFGCSKPHFCVTGLCGTKEYLAPEIIRSDHEIYTKDADLWALGIILYEMTYGELLYKVLQIFYRVKKIK